MAPQTAVQQCRSERRGQACAWDGEPLNDARTMLGERRVAARRGWAGEKSDFFSILLNKEFEHGRNDDISETDL